MSTPEQSQEEITRRIIEQQLHLQNHDMDIALDKIIEHVPRAIIPEDTFKQFLPLFRDGKTEIDGHNLQNAWVSIAGSAVDEVQVVDNEGNTLFNVPPILDLSLIDGMAVNHREGSLKQISTMHQLEAHNLPGVAHHTFAMNLLESIPQYLDEKNPIHGKRVEQWSNILQRYGAPANTEQQTTAADGVGKKSILTFED